MNFLKLSICEIVCLWIWGRGGGGGRESEENLHSPYQLCKRVQDSKTKGKLVNNSCSKRSICSVRKIFNADYGYSFKNLCTVAGRWGPWVGRVGQSPSLKEGWGASQPETDPLRHLQHHQWGCLGSNTVTSKLKYHFTGPGLWFFQSRVWSVLGSFISFMP